MRRILFAVLAMQLFSSNAFALEVGDTAPCLTLRQIQTDGSVTEGCIRDRSEGQRFTILEFFATWCGPCRRNVPNVGRIASETADIAQTRKVAIERDEEKIRGFIAQYADHIHYPVALEDDQRSAVRTYELGGVPTMMILDENNVIVYKHLGTLRESDIQEILNIVK